MKLCTLELITLVGFYFVILMMLCESKVISCPRTSMKMNEQSLEHHKLMNTFSVITFLSFLLLLFNISTTGRKLG